MRQKFRIVVCKNGTSKPHEILHHAEFDFNFETPSSVTDALIQIDGYIMNVIDQKEIEAGVSLGSITAAIYPDSAGMEKFLNLLKAWFEFLRPEKPFEVAIMIEKSTS